jgi:hypothetical protein
MPTRRPPPTPERPDLTAEQKRRCIERFERCIRSLEAFDPTLVQKRHGVPEVLALEAAIDEAISAAFGHGTPAYKRYGSAATLDNGPHIVRFEPFGGSAPPGYVDPIEAQEARHYFAEGKTQSIALLRQAIRKKKEKHEE